MLFDGEEDFVLPASRLTPSRPAKPYKIEGWADIQRTPRPKSPVKKPIGCPTLRETFKKKIQGLREARRKAPAAIGRVAGKLSAAKQRFFDAVRGGFQRTVGGFFGKRKRVEDHSESIDTPIQVKRGRFDSGNEALAALETHENGHLDGEEVHGEVFDVPVPDSDGYEDIEDGRAEDQAATEVILEVDVNLEEPVAVEGVPIEEVNEEPAAINAAPAQVNGANPLIPQAILDAIISAAANAAATAVGGDIEVLDAALAAAKQAVNGIVQPVAQPAAIPDEIVDIPVPDAPEAEPVAAPLPRRQVARRRQPRAQPAPAQPTIRRRRQPKAPARQPTVVRMKRGRGFTVKTRSDGTATISGKLNGVDCKSSSLYRDAAKGEAIIRAPKGQRIVEMAVGWSHVMFLTDQKQLMIIGSNKHGQLGSSPDRNALFRAANQTANNICRPPCNTAHLKFKSIWAIGNESWAWTDDGTAYRCGSGAFWDEAVMVQVPGMKNQVRYGARSV